MSPDRGAGGVSVLLKGRGDYGAAAAYVSVFFSIYNRTITVLLVTR
jgi:hypothetical protein